MDVLSTVADNPALVSALKELLERYFKVESINTNEVSDVALGQIYRANIAGLTKLEEAFKELMKHKTPMTPVPREPRGR